jgi:hypothetical protein
MHSRETLSLSLKDIFELVVIRDLPESEISRCETPTKNSRFTEAQVITLPVRLRLKFLWRGF